MGRCSIDEGEATVGIFQRGERLETAIADDMLDDNIDESRRQLRDEVDVDPLVEEATERLREELKSLVARDEWGRELAWRYVARIALGPVLAKLRDQETTIRLLAATTPGAQVEPERTVDDDVLDALEVALEQAPPVELIEQPGPADTLPIAESVAADLPTADAEPAPGDIRFRAF
jgi:hypothetical protein